MKTKRFLTFVTDLDFARHRTFVYRTKLYTTYLNDAEIFLLGIIYNNQMDDFSQPGSPNFYGYAPSPANFIKPCKLNIFKE
jgi:hypothetical protein